MFVPVEKKQVLVADSDPVFVKTISHIFEEHGFDTITALSVQGVFTKASTLDVDMIMLGESLPDGNGFDVCEMLKRNRSTEHIPIVMINCNFSSSEQRVRSYHRGADDCIARDLDREEIFARMEAIWRRGNGVFRGLREARQQQVVQELSTIINEGLIQPHFQPIYFLEPFRLFGLEVLSRPYNTTILTDAEALFKAAAKYDMYYPLEMLCWRKAIDIVASHTKNEHIFFNCNPYIVESSRFGEIRSIFEKGGIPFQKVVLEITERSSITEYDLFYQRLAEYREQGFSFAIDDVGGGYASLESIVATKPEIVKIDAHIVRGVHLDRVKRSIVKFISAFCKENGIVSIAEGVETREELDAIKSLGIDAVQGYFLFRPTPELNIRYMKDVAVSFS